VISGVFNGRGTHLEPILGGAQLGKGDAIVLLILCVGIGKGMGMGMPQLAKSLLVAWDQCAGVPQLLVLGAWVLEQMFDVTSVWPSILYAWIIGVGCLAAYEASSCVEFTYQTESLGT
jgi:hypothetical protein